MPCVDGNNAFHVRGSVPLAKCHTRVTDEAMMCSNNGQIAVCEPYLRRLLRYDGSSFSSPPKPVSGAIAGSTSSINVVDSSCTPTHSSSALCRSTCTHKVTVHYNRNCWEGIRCQLRGLIIHRVPVALDMPAIILAITQLMNVFKSAQGIREPNPITESPKKTLPRDFTVTHTHTNNDKALDVSLTCTSAFVCELLSILSPKDVLPNSCQVKTILLQPRTPRTAKVVLNMGERLKTLSSS